MKTIQDLLKTLTYADAEAYMAVTDKACHIETQHLDPNDIPRFNRHVWAVEDYLLHLLQFDIK